MFQARLLRPYADKFLRASGVAPGMHVLDLGSGVGDVALLTADIVGPGGRVIGLDRDVKGLERACQRTVEQGCSSWSRSRPPPWMFFHHRTIRRCGRSLYIALSAGRCSYHSPGDALSQAGWHCCIFMRSISPMQIRPSPSCELWDRAYCLLAEVFRRGGAPRILGAALVRRSWTQAFLFPLLSRRP